MAKKDENRKFKGFDKDDIHNSNSGLSFVYPNGATLSVQKPSFPLLSSGPISYPMNRPLCAGYMSKNKKGKIIVMGSCKFCSDSYFDKEDNSKIISVLF